MQLKFRQEQTILTREGVMKQTKLDRLRLLRENYYTQLLRELETLQIRKKQCIMSFRNTIKEIDAEIEREIRKTKRSEV